MMIPYYRDVLFIGIELGCECIIEVSLHMWLDRQMNPLCITFDNCEIVSFCTDHKDCDCQLDIDRVLSIIEAKYDKEQLIDLWKVCSKYGLMKVSIAEHKYRLNDLTSEESSTDI